MKVKILAVNKTGVALNNGGEILMIMGDPPAEGGKLYKSFDQKFLTVVGTEQEVAVRTTKYKGEKEFILDFPKAGGGGFGGGKSYGKSAEELAYMERDSARRTDAMYRSYAKDMFIKLVEVGVIKDLSESAIKTKFDWLMSVVSGKAPAFKASQPEPHAPLDDSDIPF